MALIEGLRYVERDLVRVILSLGLVFRLKFYFVHRKGSYHAERFTQPTDLTTGQPYDNRQVSIKRTKEVVVGYSQTHSLRLLILDKNFIEALPQDFGALCMLEELRINGEFKWKCLGDYVCLSRAATYQTTH